MPYKKASCSVLDYRNRLGNTRAMAGFCHQYDRQISTHSRHYPGNATKKGFAIQHRSRIKRGRGRYFCEDEKISTTTPFITFIIEDQRVDLRLEAGFGSVGFHDVMDIKVRRLLVRVLVDGMNPSYQLARFTNCVCRDVCLAVDRRLSTADIQGLPQSTRMNPPLTQGCNSPERGARLTTSTHDDLVHVISVEILAGWWLITLGDFLGYFRRFFQISSRV